MKAKIKKILQYLKVEDNIEISILFTNDKFIRRLNKKYRGIDESTDVLSFSFQEEKEESSIIEENIMLGDIIISVETAQRQAYLLNHSVEKEITFLLIHGLLHLLGFDHKEGEEEKVMREKELELLNIFDFSESF